jgi:hypothetical protein
VAVLEALDAVPYHLPQTARRIKGACAERRLNNGVINRCADSTMLDQLSFCGRPGISQLLGSRPGIARMGHAALVGTGRVRLDSGWAQPALFVHVNSQTPRQSRFSSRPHVCAGADPGRALQARLPALCRRLQRPPAAAQPCPSRPSRPFATSPILRFRCSRQPVSRSLRQPYHAISKGLVTPHRMGLIHKLNCRMEAYGKRPGDVRSWPRAQVEKSRLSVNALWHHDGSPPQRGAECSELWLYARSGVLGSITRLSLDARQAGHGVGRLSLPPRYCSTEAALAAASSRGDCQFQWEKHDLALSRRRCVLEATKEVAVLA